MSIGFSIFNSSEAIGHNVPTAACPFNATRFLQ